MNVHHDTYIHVDVFSIYYINPKYTVHRIAVMTQYIQDCFKKLLITQLMLPLRACASEIRQFFVTYCQHMQTTKHNLVFSLVTHLGPFV